MTEEYCTTKVMNIENSIRKNIKSELGTLKHTYVHTYEYVLIRGIHLSKCMYLSNLDC